MTNHERLMRVFESPDNMIEMIRRMNLIDDGEMDWSTWLRSEDPEIFHIGDKGYFEEAEGKRLPCIIKRKTTILAQTYYEILLISGESIFDDSFDVQQLTVPDKKLHWDK